MEKLILVTGASRGLGYATAAALATPGTHIIAVARTVGGLEELDDVVSASGATATLVPLDITDEAGLQHLGKSIHDRWGHLDAFIHCAAHAAPLSPVGHISTKDLNTSWEVNARATQRLITMLDPLLKVSPMGQAVHVHDPHISGKFSASYAATKNAARDFVSIWRNESEQTGPSVHIFEPAPMPTALRARFFPGEDRAALAAPATQAAKIKALIR